MLLKLTATMYSSSAFTFFFFFVFFFSYIASGQMIITSTSWVTFTEKNETIVSPGAIFELGLFKAKKDGINENSDRWYLGIWYKRFPETIVWIANRDQPLYNIFGTLNISNSSLVLGDKNGVAIWSTRLEENLIMKKRGPLVAQLMGNGNFVLRDQKKNGILWQSFDHPVDILIPRMKLGSDHKILQSWKTLEDPSYGNQRYETSSHQILEARETILESFIIGPHRSRIDPIFANVFLTSRKNQDHTYNLRGNTNTTFYVFLKLVYTGSLLWSQWTPPSREWKTLLRFPDDTCSGYNTCGPNSYCHMSPVRSCTCIQGYLPIHHGCLRNTRFNCLKARLEVLKYMKLPDSTNGCIVETTIDFEECKKRCLENCNCTAVANTIVSNGRLACVMWNRDLIDFRNYSDNMKGQDLYVKLEAVTHHTAKSENKKEITIGLTVAAAAVILLVSLAIFLIWKRKNNRARTVTQTETQMPEMETDDEEWRSKLIDFDVISEATNHFSESNIIGKGGFGVVYKGWLEGQVVAVKRLCKISAHGIKGFDNEVKIIAVVQHINLVRLIGFFSNQTEQILVYEFLENSSLDTYIFDTNRSSILNWKMRFGIVNGIARGLSYLHQDSRLRIIHLDLKPNNILLDKEMIPKISDFGIAKMLRRDDEEANTKTAAGTFGYMSPEYAMYNIYSTKSDVFSFGVMLLEIISGRKNNAFSRLNRGENLLFYTWRLWIQGKGLEIVDPVVKDPASSSSSVSTFCEEEVLRCIQIGLLCVQEAPEDRPMMSMVVLMLGSGNVEIANPKPPVETASSSSHQQQQQQSVT